MSIRFVQLQVADKYWALPQILQLVEQARSDNTAPHLNLQERDYYQRYFAGEGCVIAVMDEAEMLGFSLLGLEAFLSPLWEPYLQHKGIDHAQAAVLVQTLLRADQRGKGLGKRLTQWPIKLAQQLGRPHLFVTVAPENTINLGILQRQGFTIMERRVIYSQQLERYLMYRAPAPLIDPASSERLQQSRAIAVIDSGFGGLNVVAALLQRQLPSSAATIGGPQILYYVNAAPSDERGYNQMTSPQEKLQTFSRVLQQVQQKLAPESIYIACNTLSTLLPELDAEPLNRTEVKGIVDIGVAQIVDFQRQNPASKLLLFATETTIESGIYSTQVGAAGGDAERLIPVAAAGLATAISNDPEGTEVSARIQQLLEELDLAGLAQSPTPLGVFLGCTHYGFRAERFTQECARFGLKTQLLDPNQAFAEHIAMQQGVNYQPGQSLFLSRYALPECETRTIAGLLRNRSASLAQSVLSYRLDPELF